MLVIALVAFFPTDVRTRRLKCNTGTSFLIGDSALCNVYQGSSFNAYFNTQHFNDNRLSVNVI